MCVCVAALLLSLHLLGCIDTAPQIRNDITPAPQVSVGVDDTAKPVESPLVGTDNAKTDALGNVIFDEHHFEQYLQFKNVRVYKSHGDTFVDCIAVSSYPLDLSCSMRIEFYDEYGNLLVAMPLRSSIGSINLNLKNGETHLYADIQTDIDLLNKQFELVFDENSPIQPNN